MNSVISLSHDVGKKSACEALLVPRATFYRHHSAANSKQSQQSFAVRPQPPQALDAEQRQAVIDL